MRFGVLGPLEVWEDGRQLELGSGGPRALLALLLLHANQVVSTDRLAEDLWSGRPPQTAAKVVQGYVSRLRRTLPDGTIATRGSGYLLRAEETDAGEFERLLERARGEEPPLASATLNSALGLWRGSAFADVEFEPWAQAEIARLDELRLVAREERIDADLRLGRAELLVPELEALVAAHPLRERLRVHLMLALYRCGRQADALEAFASARRRLVEELGIEPGPDLQDMQRQILGHDPKLSPPRRSHPVTTVKRRGGRLFLAGVILLVAAGTAAALELRGGTGIRLSVAGNGLALVDPRTGQIAAEMSVAGAPTSAALGAGALWVSSSSADTVYRIDPQKKTVVDTIPVGHSPNGIAVGGDGVWVANHDDDTVAWINPKSNTVVREIPVGSGPTAVAYGYGSVWVTNGNDRSLSRIDPAGGRVTKEIQTDAVGRGIAVGGGFVWVTDESSRTVVQIDPASNTIAGRPTVGTGPTGVAYLDGSIWVANALDDTVSQIDATTLVGRAVIPVAGSPSAVATGDGSVWVSAEFGARVLRIDPAHPMSVDSIRVGNRLQGLAAGPGGVWVAAQSSGKGHYGGRLVVLDTSKLDSIDPAHANLTTAYALMRTVYDGLTNTRRVGGSAGTQIVPDLAAALPQPTDGGRSYTFHLRRGIRYSNGTPLRPQDFRRALERVLILEGWQAPAFARIVGARRCRPHGPCDLSSGVIVNGPSTLTVRLSAPDPTLLFDLASVAPVPAGTPLKDIGTKPVPSTGGYQIQSYVPGRLLTIVRNPYFHIWSPTARPRGYPDEIVYRIVKNPNQAVRDVLAGKADLLTEAVPIGRVSGLAARYPNQLHLVPQQATVFAFMNVRRPPFNDIRVRQALNYAVDRTRLAALHGGEQLAQPTCQLVPPTTPGYIRYCPYTIGADASGAWKAPDLARARRLIAASKTNDQTVVVWTTSYFHREGQYIVEVLQQLGFRTRLHYVADLAGYFDALAKTPSAQVGLGAWFGAPHAIDILSLLGCHSGNYGHFCDKRIDARVTQLANAQPYSAAAKLAASIDRELVDRAPWVPLFTPRLADFTSSRVGNYQASPYGYPLFDQMWVR